MAKRDIVVMLPTGSRREAEEARAALGHPQRSLAMGSTGAHSPGQRLNCDVVVIGGGASTVEADAAGHQVYRLASMADLASLDLTKAPGVAIKPSTLATSEGTRAPSEDTDELIGPCKDDKEESDEYEVLDEPDEPDELDEMNRPELIQYAAKRWPGERRWASLDNPALRATIRELSAS